MSRILAKKSSPNTHAHGPVAVHYNPRSRSAFTCGLAATPTRFSARTKSRVTCKRCKQSLSTR